MSGRADSERNTPRKVTKSDEDRRLIRKMLQQQTVLSALSTYELEEMIDFMDVLPLKIGQSCDLTGCLCVILEGAVYVNAPRSDGDGLGDGPGGMGDNEPKQRFTSGQVFGQVGLFYDTTRAVSVGGGLDALADSPTRVCKLSGTDFRAGMEFSRQAQIKANMKLLSSIPIFSKMSMAERVRLCDASEVVTYRLHDVIIREREQGDTFYILRTGGAKVFRGQDKKTGEPTQIDYKYSGDFFGEAALLQDAPRNATVVADEPNTECLLVDRKLFKEQLLGPLKDIMDRSESTLQQQMVLSVPLFAQLSADKRKQLCERLKLQSFTDGEFIFRQGDVGDRLYIIKSGQVSVLSSGQLNSSMSGSPAHVREIDRLYNGQYFGERALIKQEPRMASTQSVGTLECYSLSSDDFDALALKDTVAWTRRWDKEDTRDVSQLKVLKALGSGAFGTAWLVLHEQTKRCYALKALDKHMVKRQNWTSVVVREKEIFAHLSPHPCVITMFNSFQSPSQLFMLMELATGGELFQLMEKVERFSPAHARFYTGCVVLAISHLHKHGIVFRDLKPENLLITATGYLKLIDMGFAKRLPRGEKTYTLCGTPYYLAPEMILHRGHSFALDWWTVGVLTFEMIEGDPPFMGSSETEVYGKVTRLQYWCTTRFPDAAANFIEKLLRREPDQRLGNLRNGEGDVMAHPWFDDLNWDHLYDGILPVPYVPDAPSSLDNLTASSAPNGKTLRLSDAMTNEHAFGYWPGW